VIKQACGSQAIFLDDLSKERNTEDVSTIWYELFDKLLRAGRTLICSTNLTLERLEERYDDGMVDRLRGMCALIAVEGESGRASGDRRYSRG
jgi:DNA replication protein DnaC